MQCISSYRLTASDRSQLLTKVLCILFVPVADINKTSLDFGQHLVPPSHQHTSKLQQVFLWLMKISNLDRI